ncbi:AbrB family transcriptional regulator [Mesobacillus harenae]|uniref:AbrB family transcriptional regulator n=1 Tax=Mesobacillus harenae TaxID=2213203 RepID=UPI0015804AB5|nr:AbrB family transcriptional regulator [Mesobacillus harenae]
MDKQTHVKIYGFGIALITALAGGLVFNLINTPIPWLLGPMAAILIVSRFQAVLLYWPPVFRDIALIIIGYSIGLAFTKESTLQIAGSLPIMLLMTVLVISFCAVIAYLFSKLTRVDYPTILTGSIPGGLSQMIVLAEETKGIDVTIVTFLQVARLLMIVFFVPFLLFGPMVGAENSFTSASFSETAAVQASMGRYIIFAVVAVAGALIAKKLQFPTAVLLGPMLATAILTISGIQGPPLPVHALDISQFFLGVYIGRLMKPEKLKHKTKMISLALLSGMLMIMASYGLSLVLVNQLHISLATGFLSLAPGGMDQMAILAHEVNADLSMVTGYQLFRLFFIYFAIPPILKVLFKIFLKKEAASNYKV